jgi:hypothetical protein
LESSADLRDWSPIQTNSVTGTALPVNRPISKRSGAEFLRAKVN